MMGSSVYYCAQRHSCLAQFGAFLQLVGSTASRCYVTFDVHTDGSSTTQVGCYFVHFVLHCSSGVSRNLCVCGVSSHFIVQFRDVILSVHDDDLRSLVCCPVDDIIVI